MTAQPQPSRYPPNTSTYTLAEIMDKLRDLENHPAAWYDEDDIIEAQIMVVHALGVCVECLHPTADPYNGHGAGGVPTPCSTEGCPCDQ